VDIEATGTLGADGTEGYEKRVKGGAEIKINTIPRGNEERVLKHMATLLHGIIHAFLDVYMLRRENKSRFDLNGYTGHGQFWQGIAYAMETAVSPLLGVSLDLGRESALWQEIQEAEGERIDASRWSMSVHKNQRAPANIQHHLYQTKIRGGQRHVVVWPARMGIER